jgi:hypothetical protein
VSTSRRRELWEDRSSGETFVVELEGDRVLAAEGPVDPKDLDRVHAIWTEASHGRMPAFSGLATDLDRRREEFDRRPLSAA